MGLLRTSGPSSGLKRQFVVVNPDLGLGFLCAFAGVIHRLSTAYPQVIHRLSTGYPQGYALTKPAPSRREGGCGHFRQQKAPRPRRTTRDQSKVACERWSWTGKTPMSGFARSCSASPSVPSTSRNTSAKNPPAILVLTNQHLRQQWAGFRRVVYCLTDRRKSNTQS